MPDRIPSGPVSDEPQPEPEPIISDGEGPPYYCPYCDAPEDADGFPSQEARNGHIGGAHPGIAKPRQREDTTSAESDPTTTSTSAAPLPYGDAFRTALDSLGGSPSDEDDPEDPLDTWAERAAVTVGVIMGILLAHDPVFRFLVLTLPVLIVAGGGAVMRVRRVSPEAADAVAQNVFQYYLGAFFGWGSIFVIHNYLDEIKEFLGPLLGAI